MLRTRKVKGNVPLRVFFDRQEVGIGGQEDEDAAYTEHAAASTPISAASTFSMVP
jgi:hypothetical protein